MFIVLYIINFLFLTPRKSLTYGASSNNTHTDGEKEEQTSPNQTTGVHLGSVVFLQTCDLRTDRSPESQPLTSVRSSPRPQPCFMAGCKVLQYRWLCQRAEPSVCFISSETLWKNRRHRRRSLGFTSLSIAASAAAAARFQLRAQRRSLTLFDLFMWFLLCFPSVDCHISVEYYKTLTVCFVLLLKSPSLSLKSW